MYFIEVNDRKKKKYSSLGGHNWLEKQLHWQYIIQYADYILKNKVPASSALLFKIINRSIINTWAQGETLTCLDLLITKMVLEIEI